MRRPELIEIDFVILLFVIGIPMGYGVLRFLLALAGGAVGYESLPDIAIGAARLILPKER